MSHENLFKTLPNLPNTTSDYLNCKACVINSKTILIAVHKTIFSYSIPNKTYHPIQLPENACHMNTTPYISYFPAMDKSIHIWHKLTENGHTSKLFFSDVDSRVSIYTSTPTHIHNQKKNKQHSLAASNSCITRFFEAWETRVSFTYTCPLLDYSLCHFVVTQPSPCSKPFNSRYTQL